MILLRSINHVLDELDMTLYPAELDGSPVISMGVKDWRDLDPKHQEEISGKDLRLIFFYEDLYDLRTEYDENVQQLKQKWIIE